MSEDYEINAEIEDGLLTIWRGDLPHGWGPDYDTANQSDILVLAEHDLGRLIARLEALRAAAKTEP